MNEPGFAFEHALISLKKGKRVMREGWNGKGMWIVLVEPTEKPTSGFSSFINGPDPIPTKKFIAMKTADNYMVPWIASQTDILACDWHEVE